jgi:predicted HTH domain antitoxin
MVVWQEGSSIETEFFGDRLTILDFLTKIQDKPNKVMGVWPGQYRFDCFNFGSAKDFLGILRDSMRGEEEAETIRQNQKNQEEQETNTKILELSEKCVSFKQLASLIGMSYQHILYYLCYREDLKKRIQKIFKENKIKMGIKVWEKYP